MNTTLNISELSRLFEQSKMLTASDIDKFYRNVEPDISKSTVVCPIMCVSDYKS
jgi:hypothetical protein